MKPPRRLRMTAEDLARKHQMALNTFVREVWSEIPEEEEVKLRSLKAWGFDLIRGLRQGEAAMFVSEIERGRQVGDVYEEQGESFEVHEILSELPKGARLFIRVALEERRGVIRAYYQATSGQRTELFSLPAAELLLAFFKKQGLAYLLKAFHSSGLTTELIQKNGDEGRAYTFEELPPHMRRPLREARDVLRKHTGMGRFTLAYFGQNKDGEDRYVVTWLLPTIRLFHLEVAQHVDKLLAAMD